MPHLAGPLYQLNTTQSWKIVIDNKYVIVVIPRKFFERAITIGAKLDNPFLTDEHLADEIGNLFIVLDVQNGNLRRGPLWTCLCDLPFDLSGLGEKVVL